MPQDSSKSDRSHIAENILSPEMRIALGGYRMRCRSNDDTQETVINFVVNDGMQRVMMGSMSVPHDTEAEDISLLDAMIGYMNAGGNPKRIIELAERVSDMPRLSVPGYAAIGGQMSSDWTSYWKRLDDGKIFEIYHDEFAKEITSDELYASMERNNECE